MSDQTLDGVSAELAELKREIAELRAARPVGRRGGEPRWRRPLVVVAVTALAAGMITGVAGATGSPGSTTNVSFVALTPAKKILSAITIATKKSTSPVVIGGTTTVPSNATTVQIVVTAKGTAAGTLNFYPSANAAGASGQSLAYPKSTTTTASVTIQENVGQGGAVTFYNAGTGTATVTATITGYSTQVTAGDINGNGGSNGQVLTNDGSGGATWATQGQSFASGTGYAPLPIGLTSQTTVLTLTVPVGSYQVTATYSAYATSPDLAYCTIIAPSGFSSAYGTADLAVALSNGNYTGQGSAQMLLATSTGGVIKLACNSNLHTGVNVFTPRLTAVQVNSTSGLVVN